MPLARRTTNEETLREIFGAAKTWHQKQQGTEGILFGGVNLLIC
jgi:hypothetical protein